MAFQGFKKVIYASSAAVYGAEEKDFSERIYGLRPLNAYGFTKLMLDQLLSERNDNIYGLRFFNVFGGPEQHKGKMQSIVSKLLNAPSDALTISLYKSYREGIAHGEQKRDFIHVSDICAIIYHFICNDCAPGIYNAGTGIARSFNDLARAINPDALIKYTEMPMTLRRQYQYFTQADLTKLRTEAGFTHKFHTLEEGIALTKAALEND
jgi:ADP-L-glycero-D-manno-heptose 6-epimerase